MVDQDVSRRSFLRLGAGAVGLGAGLPALLAACGGSDTKVLPAATRRTTTSAPPPTTAAAVARSTTTSGPRDFGKLSLRFSWIKNAEFAGSYIADDKGYYLAEGFSAVELITGGPSASPVELDVESGKALVGISSPDLVAAAITKGADLRIIGTKFQKNPFAVMSLAKDPIKKPTDMYGRKFGLQDTNKVVWDAFVKASGIDNSKINVVSVGFDPQGLVNGQADCWFSFIINEPNALKVRGIDTYSFLIADFGYPLVAEVYVVRKDTIAKRRDALKAFLRAEVKGWQEAKRNSKLGADLTVGKYGKELGLNVVEQELEVRSAGELIWTTDTKANGAFTASERLLSDNLGLLRRSGLDITAEGLFDMSLLAEIYAEDPALKVAP